MNRYINLAKVFIRLSLSRKIMIFRMIMILVYTSILVRFIPLRFYYNRYIAGNSDLKSRNMQPFKDQIVMYRRLMLLIPWKVTCLIESLAFFIYFKQYGVQIPFFIGVKTGVQMEAHAWNFNSNSQGYSAIDK
jgi:hypothetical protein